MLSIVILIIISFLADLAWWLCDSIPLSLHLLAPIAIILFAYPVWLVIPCAICLAIESILMHTMATSAYLYLIPATFIIYRIRSLLALPLWLSISITYLALFSLHLLVHNLAIPPTYTFFALSGNLIVLNLVLKYIIKVA